MPQRLFARNGDKQKRNNSNLRACMHREKKRSKEDYGGNSEKTGGTFKRRSTVKEERMRGEEGNFCKERLNADEGQIRRGNVRRTTPT